jgi:hypothetical protein
LRRKPVRSFTVNAASRNAVAFGAPHQIGAFFESDGASVIQPTPAELSESPIRAPLPEDPFYMPRPR